MATTTTSNNNCNKNKNTLTDLTERFIDLLERTPDGMIDLNNASKVLDVKKRRIYDITNVLEGIGLLQKISKSTIQKTTNQHISTTANLHQLHSGLPQMSAEMEKQQLLEIHALKQKDQILEAEIKMLEQQINSDLCSEQAFVTYHDVKQFFINQTVIAVKAPPNTRLEVNENLQIWMKSDSGEIEVYLCPNDYSTSHPYQQQQQQHYHSSSSYKAHHHHQHDPTLSSAIDLNHHHHHHLHHHPHHHHQHEHEAYNFALDDNETISSLFDDNILLSS